MMQPAALGSTGLALPRGLGSSRYLGVMLVLLALLTLSPAVAGHADAQNPTALLLPSTTLHVVAISIWIGGLAMLVFVLRGAMRPLDLVNRGRLLASVLVRFSTIAGVCVAVVFLTGVVQSFVYVRNLDNLLHTEYGQILIAKILVVLGMLGIGGYNRQRSVPRLRKIADGGESPGAPASCSAGRSAARCCSQSSSSASRGAGRLRPGHRHGHQLLVGTVRHHRDDRARPDPAHG